MGRPTKLGRRFDEIVDWAREYTGLTFRIRTVVGLRLDGHKCWGSCYVDSNKLLIILIERKSDLSQAIDSLLHEVAHCMQFEKEPFIEDLDDQHTAIWGREYAKLMRAFLKRNNECE